MPEKDPVRVAIGRLSARKRWAHSTPEERKANTRAAAEARTLIGQRSRNQRLIEELVAKAPLLTVEQRDQLALLLTPAGEPTATPETGQVAS